MLGLAVLFFLALWLFITVFAMWIGWKVGKRLGVWSGLIGLFLGFMLTMGGFIVHWTVEYHEVKKTVTRLCETEAGIKVYVTPEEWRKQIGEDEWETLIPYGRRQREVFERNHKIIDGIEYYSAEKFNQRLIMYAKHIDLDKHMGKTNYIVIDTFANKPLLEVTYFSAGVGAWLAGGSYKSWLNNVRSCSKSTNEKFYKLIKPYSNDKTGEDNE